MYGRVIKRRFEILDNNSGRFLDPSSIHPGRFLDTYQQESPGMRFLKNRKKPKFGLGNKQDETPSKRLTF